MPRDRAPDHYVSRRRYREPHVPRVRRRAARTAFWLIVGAAVVFLAAGVAAVAGAWTP